MWQTARLSWMRTRFSHKSHFNPTTNIIGKEKPKILNIKALVAQKSDCADKEMKIKIWETNTMQKVDKYMCNRICCHWQCWKDLRQRRLCQNVFWSLGEEQPSVWSELQEVEGLQLEVKVSVRGSLLPSWALLPQLLRQRGGWCCPLGQRRGKLEARKEIAIHSGFVCFQRWRQRPLRSSGSAQATSSPSHSWWDLHSQNSTFAL